MTPSLPSSPVRGLLLVFSFSFSISSLAVAVPLDLGQKLTYVRLHHLPADLAQVATVWPAPALIIDLRYAVEEGTRAAGPGLPARARAEPLFVLVGPATPETAVVALRVVAPGLLTLGLPAPGIPPDIAVAVTPEDDRRAYNASIPGSRLSRSSARNLPSRDLTKPHSCTSGPNLPPPQKPGPPLLRR